MSRHRAGRYSLSQEFFPETKLVIIPEENASSNNQLEISKQSNDEKQETNENEPQKRKTVLDLVKANELRIKQINNEKQEVEKRLSARAKNRELWKETLEQLRVKIKQQKEGGQEVNVFYKNNKIGLEEIGIYSSKDLSEYLKGGDDDDDDWSSLDFQPNVDMNINRSNRIMNSSNQKFQSDEQRSSITFGLKDKISPINPVYYTKVPPLKNMPKTQQPIQTQTVRQSLSLSQTQPQPLAKSQTINYHQNIISSINAMSVPQYTLSSYLINDPSFLDVICITCYEIVKYDQMDSHSERCIASPIEPNTTIEKENTFDDCNSRMYKMYSSLKERGDEYLNSINESLVQFYKSLIKIIYQILINNNSIEEIDECSLALNELLNTALIKITGKERAVLDIFCRRIVQLIYIKTIEMRKLFAITSSIEESKEHKETNQTSSEDNIMMKEKETVFSNARTSQTNHHARIYSTNALSEIYSEIDDRRDEEYDNEDSSSASASMSNTGSAMSSQGSFFQNNLISRTHNFQDLSKGLQQNQQQKNNQLAVKERISYSPMPQKFFSQDLTKH